MACPKNQGHRSYPPNMGRGQNRPGQRYPEHMPSTSFTCIQQQVGYMHKKQNQAVRKQTYHHSAQSAIQTHPYQRPNQQEQSVSNNQWHSVGNWNTMGQEDIVRLSKTLAFLLRHGAEKLGFQFMPGGFLYVDEILWYHKPLWNFTAEQIFEVVRTNNKQRFALQTDAEGKWMIRANQGHTTEVEGLELTRILDSSEVPKVIHGTYYEAWEQIQRTGLSRMNRIHIHFAAGMPGKSGVISGMRKSCEVVIEIDLKKAMEAGIRFFRSANNVILSPGNEKGFIPPTFFKSVFDRYSGQPLPMDFLSSESSYGQDTSSPTDQVTGERRKQEYPAKRKSEDHSKGQLNPKRMKEEMPELGSHNPRSEKDRKTPHFDKSQCKETTSYCRPQKESGKETTKQMGQKMKKKTQGQPGQISPHSSQRQEKKDLTKDDKRAGTMSKSQNKKEKQ